MVELATMYRTEYKTDGNRAMALAGHHSTVNLGEILFERHRPCYENNNGQRLVRLVTPPNPKVGAR